MADQERAGRGLRLGDRQEVGGVLERGRNSPAVELETQSPYSTEKWSGVPTDAVSVTSRLARSSAATVSGSGVAFAGHQRCGQGDVDIELQLLALASFG